LWAWVLATLIMVPLTFGLISFEAAGSGARHALVVEASSRRGS
jgi:hypothetical protein